MENEVELDVFGLAALVAEERIRLLVVDVPAERTLKGIIPAMVALAVSVLAWPLAPWADHLLFIKHSHLNYLIVSVSPSGSHELLIDILGS